MRVIEAMRVCDAEWVTFIDMDNCKFSKPMKKKNITWEKLQRIEYKHVVCINYSKKDGSLVIRYCKKETIYD